MFVGLVEMEACWVDNFLRCGLTAAVGGWGSEFLRYVPQSTEHAAAEYGVQRGDDPDVAERPVRFDTE